MAAPNRRVRGIGRVAESACRASAYSTDDIEIALYVDCHRRHCLFTKCAAIKGCYPERVMMSTNPKESGLKIVGI
jgi:hypothetical protein